MHAIILTALAIHFVRVFGLVLLINTTRHELVFYYHVTFYISIEFSAFVFVVEVFISLLYHLLHSKSFYYATQSSGSSLHSNKHVTSNEARNK